MQWKSYEVVTAAWEVGTIVEAMEEQNRVAMHTMAGVEQAPVAIGAPCKVMHHRIGHIVINAGGVMEHTSLD